MSSRRSERGFSLLETLVAMLVALTIVASVGLLGMRLTHRRTSSASVSVATSIAEKHLESLRPLRVPWTGLDTIGSDTKDVDATNELSLGGPYRRTTTIGLGPEITVGGVPRTPMRRVTVTVVHVTNPEVSVTLETYFRVSA